ncbi:translational GTPase TypA [bacterium]|nr:translational GTPase TypA [bacterium]
MSLRNIAIIAHVDHGKTTLVDQLMRQCNIFRENQAVRECFLDSNDLERERGITIFSKNISLRYRDVKINLIDTPGHSDFGGEVERVLKMADGVLLLVDAAEGPMPQTRFVLQKALGLTLKPIVVINKVDRPDRRVDEVLNEIFDLFVELDASDAQLDFRVLYASGRDGWAAEELTDERKNLSPLLDAVLEEIPPPPAPEGPAQMLVTTLDYSDYVGRIGIGRVFRGTLKKNTPLVVLHRGQDPVRIQIKDLLVFDGLERQKVEEVPAGELCAVVGMEDIDIGDTIADAESPEALPALSVEEPTLSMEFRVNDSPFAGREGKYFTSRHIRDRLFRESKTDVALRVEDTATTEAFKVFGRGILHLSILIETMRREGYEFAAGQPKVLFKEKDGQILEPIEVLVIDVPEPHSGKAIELVSQRRAEMSNMSPKGGHVRLEFHIPSRGLIGLRTRLLTLTAGEAVMVHRFLQYEVFKGAIPGRQNGSMISMAEGPAIPYGIDGLQDRGKFFISPGDRVYAGQVVGEHCKENDIVVNVQKSKKLTNMRAAGSDRNIVIVPAIRMSLEQCLEYVSDDELVEITPQTIRLRKLHLDETARKREKIREKGREGDREKV